MKKIKFIIDKQGNFRTETLEGFSGNSCNKTLDEIVMSIGGNATLIDAEDKDDKYKKEDVENFISGLK